MTFGQFVMRILSPTCESQRRDFRYRLAEATAHAEDLTRTLTHQLIDNSSMTLTPRLVREVEIAKK